MKISREIVTFCLLVWMLLALGEDLFAHQGMREMANVAGTAGRSLSHWFCRLCVAAALFWNLIPAGGGGGGGHK